MLFCLPIQHSRQVEEVQCGQLLSNEMVQSVGGCPPPSFLYIDRAQRDFMIPQGFTKRREGAFLAQTLITRLNVDRSAKGREG